MKHLPFDSIYRPDFEVVEERQGKTTLFPHTDQLSRLHRALDLEFRGALPPRMARADKRADGYHKILLKWYALWFALSTNAARKDQVRLFALPDHDLVFKIAVVQQITENRRRGAVHWFRFYTGADFFPEIYLSGRRVVFTDHVLERFSSRAPMRLGADLSYLIATLFNSPVISAPVGTGRALIASYQDSILAFTYKEQPGEFVITTCLTINEINSMGFEIPPLGINSHYGRAFKRPPIRNWLTFKAQLDYYKAWENKTPFTPPRMEPDVRWQRRAAHVRDFVNRMGHGPGSKVCFIDNLPGPYVLEMRPNQVEPQFDEVAGCNAQKPSDEWPQVFAQRYGEPWPPPDSGGQPTAPSIRP